MNTNIFNLFPLSSKLFIISLSTREEDDNRWALHFFHFLPPLSHLKYCSVLYVSLWTWFPLLSDLTLLVDVGICTPALACFSLHLFFLSTVLCYSRKRESRVLLMEDWLLLLPGFPCSTRHTYVCARSTFLYIPSWKRRTHAIHKSMYTLHSHHRHHHTKVGTFYMKESKWNLERESVSELLAPSWSIRFYQQQQ